MTTARDLITTLTVYDRHVRGPHAASGLGTLATVAYDEDGEVAFEIADTPADLAGVDDLEPANPDEMGFATESPMDAVYEIAAGYRQMLRIELQRHADTHPCNECGRPVTYHQPTEAWRHVLSGDARRGCGLVPAEDRPLDDLPIPSGYVTYVVNERHRVLRDEGGAR